MNYSTFYRFCADLAISFAWTLILLTVIGSSHKIDGQSGNPAADKTAVINRNRLETVEELSESLANDLLGLSAATRDRDLRSTAEFFPFEIAAKPFPSRPTPLKNQLP